MLKSAKTILLTLLAFCVMFSVSSATASDSTSSKQIECYKKLEADNEFSNKAEMVAWYKDLVNLGCLRRNPVLTTEADIRTDSEYCVAYAKAANPLLSKKVNALKKVNRLEIKGEKKLGRILRPYRIRLSNLAKVGTDSSYKESLRLLRVFKKIDRAYTRSDFYRALMSQRLIVSNAASLQVVNFFVEGCLENKTFSKNLKYLDNRLFYEKTNNANLFKAFSYEENAIRLATEVAQGKVNMLFKTAKSEAFTSFGGKYPGIKRLNRASDGYFKAVKAPKDFVLNQGVKGPIYITKLGPYIICTSQLIYTSGGDKYFLNTQIKALPDYWVDKNMVRCAK